MEGTHAVCEGLYPVGRSHTGAGEKCEEQGVAGRSCYGLTSVPHLPALLWGEVGGGGNERKKLSLGRGNGGKVV